MGRARSVLCLGLLLGVQSARAITIRDGRITAAVSEQSCTVPKQADSFQATARQAFLWFAARQVRASDQVHVEWLDPSGAVSTIADYGELPDAAELCFTTQLPIAGFAPSSQPGTWTARVSGNGRVLFSRTFRIAAERDDGGPVVASVTWSGVRSQEIDFTVLGRGFQPNAMVLIARYTASGGWAYLASLTPTENTPTRLRVHYTGLPANEYLVIVENQDQRLSRPMPFLIETGGYKLPMPAGEPWVITQGPYGTFSHWGNSVHAYDIAPRSGRCVVAMKAGIAYTHDLGLKQDHRHHSFGNYITIDHGNGEYSHYAHLATGTFAVQNGQHVEQGQALAIAGNSGYTLGEGGGYHVHVSVTRSLAIAANSIPFQFEDLSGSWRNVANRAVVSANASPLCDCREKHRAAAVASRAEPDAPKVPGRVSVAQWWSQTVAVTRGTKALDVVLSWPRVTDDLDLHLMSPSGRHYGWYGDTTGYSGANGNPEQFHIERPEPGVWRISVQGMRGGTGPIEFTVQTSPEPGASRALASSGRQTTVRR